MSDRTTFALTELRPFDVPDGVTTRRYAFREGTRALFEVSPELDAWIRGPRNESAGPPPAGTLDDVARLDRFGFWYGPDEIPANNKLHMYALNLAHVCNLACSYCNVNQGNYTGDGPTLAERKVVDRALARIPELFGRIMPTVVFYGGEPLLNWGVLQYGVEQCLLRDANTQFQVVTNGTLIDADKAAFFAAHRFGVIVSIDGPPELQDQYRKTVGGKASSAKVEAGVHLLREHGVDFTLRATWAVDRNVSYAEVRRYLGELAGDPLRVAIGMEFQSSPCEHDKAATGFLHELGEAFRDVADDPVAKQLPASARSWANILLRADLADPPGCPAGKTAFLVTPGGTIHPCQVAAANGSLKIGTVHGGVDAGEHEHAKQSMTHARLCPGCWLEPVCQQSICPLGGMVPEDYFACVQYRKEFTGLLALMERVGYDALVRNQIHVKNALPEQILIAERLLAVRNLVARANRHLVPVFYVPIGSESRAARPRTLGGMLNGTRVVQAV
ncbi:MAG: radical SAM protein [Planctomycetota bacterium]